MKPQASLSALILAAGRGERMRPLTDQLPKPLLPVHGKPLIEWHLEALARAGIRHVVINTAWLEEAFPAMLGDGARWGLTIRYSQEGRDHGQALETAGGMAKALPWLTEQGQEAFWFIAGDLYMPGWAFDNQLSGQFLAQTTHWAHLFLVPNPAHHQAGDFGLDQQGYVRAREPALTSWNFAGVGLCRPALIADVPIGQPMPLRPCLERAIAAQRITGQIYSGTWVNVGTPAQWQALQGPALPST